MKHLCRCVLSLSVLVGLVRGQIPSAEEMLRLAEKNVEGVQDYVVDLEADVNMDRLRMPRMKAKLYFKRPDKIHFESSGFAMLPREGILLNPARLRDLYDVKMAGTDTLGGGAHYRLQLAAKKEKTRLRQLYLWVSTTNWTITRMETIPYDGRTLTLDFAYRVVDGKYLLPSMMKATFGGFLPDTTRALSALPAELAPQLQELQRAPRIGTVTLRYENYKVNAGLKDDIFERKAVD